MRLRLLTMSALAALVGALALTANASGQQRDAHPSNLTIQKQDPAFHGSVHIRDARRAPRVSQPCQRRRVRLYWENNGGHVKLVGRTISRRSDGRWTIPVKEHQGSYFAVVKRRVLPRRGGAVCAAARSRTVHVTHS